MPITSYFPDDLKVVRRGEVDGLPMCEVRHLKHDAHGHVCIYRLVQRPRGWYKVGRHTKIPGQPGRYVAAPERLGQKLSGSRLDSVLLAHAANDFNDFS